jgi:DNA-binding NarL/FixJ family response regulator
VGQSNQEIAIELGLSVGTVKNHVSLIMDKLELRDRTQLAIYAIRHNVV